MVKIIPYTNDFHNDFKRLNMEWLEKYDLIETHDLEILDDPTGTILANGGFIWLAQSGDEIVGSAGIMNEGHGTYELVKMAVTRSWQGKGISRMLMDTCMLKVKEIGAKRLTLWSNHQLETAISLYSKYGFRNVEVKDSPFETADVKMELNLQQ